METIARFILAQMSLSFFGCSNRSEDEFASAFEVAISGTEAEFLELFENTDLTPNHQIEQLSEHYGKLKRSKILKMEFSNIEGTKILIPDSPNLSPTLIPKNKLSVTCRLATDSNFDNGNSYFLGEKEGDLKIITFENNEEWNQYMDTICYSSFVPFPLVI